MKMPGLLLHMALCQLYQAQKVHNRACEDTGGYYLGRMGTNCFHCLPHWAWASFLHCTDSEKPLTHVTIPSLH